MNINLKNYNYIDWNSYYSELDRYGIEGYLIYIINMIECSRLIKGKRYIEIDSFLYQDYLERFKRTLNKLNNYYLYNYYFDKLIKVHNGNIEFEESLKNEPKVSNKPKRKPKQQKFKDEFVMHITTDLFTGETLYLYDNYKTGESITSKDGNLLETLNNKEKHKKEKKQKHISITNFTFNFKSK